MPTRTEVCPSGLKFLLANAGSMAESCFPYSTENYCRYLKQTINPARGCGRFLDPTRPRGGLRTVQYGAFTID